MLAIEEKLFLRSAVVIMSLRLDLLKKNTGSMPGFSTLSDRAHNRLLLQGNLVKLS